MVSLTRKSMRFAACVAALVAIAIAVLAICTKRGNDAPNGGTSAQSRAENHANIAPRKDGSAWLDMDAKEVVKPPPREAVDAEMMGRLMQIQDEIVQAYSNNNASLLRELRGTLPALVERIPPEQFRGAMLGFVYLVMVDVQLADLHPQPMTFSDAEDLTRFLDVRFAALLLVGDMLVKRKDFGPKLAACEGHALGALRNLERQFASAGRTDMVEAVLEYRGKVIGHVESDEGYLRAYTAVELAQKRLSREPVWTEELRSHLLGLAAFMEDRGQYRPKWLDDLIEIVEVQHTKAKSAQ